MLEYMNNYYRVNGEECKDTILKYICDEQLCTQAVLVYLYTNTSNVGDKMKELVNRITVNLCYEERYYTMLRSVLLPIDIPKISPTQLETNEMMESTMRNASSLSPSKKAYTPLQEE